ncbi:hypothetical protein BH10BDE1_BH10BDE1_35340 [soil metagenome]
MKTLVTICVPTYNSEKTIGETLESILNQSFKDIVVKIFDNASTDRTVEIVQAAASRDPRVEVFEFKENVGAEGNFNRCLAAASGNYTAIFHADDLYEPDMVDRQVSFLERHPQCAAVAAQASIINESGKKIGLRFLPTAIGKEIETSFSFDELFSQVLNFGNFITCPSVMARSEVYQHQIRIWDGANFGSSADLDVWLRLAKIGRFGLLTVPLMRYRVSEASFTVRETKRRFSEHDFLKVLRTYSAKFSGGRGPASTARDIQFHEFKDVAARRGNIIRAGRKDLAFPTFDGGKMKLLPLALRSVYHFKFLAISYAVFALSGLLKILRLHK